MFKESKSTLGELWAEKIAAEIGALLGLDMMNVQFAKKGETYGVIMENFVAQGHDLRDGGQLLLKTIPTFNVNSLDNYTIENVMAEIKQFNMEKYFLEMCVFDFLIASTDRHCENWGIIHNMGEYYFAPIFDNGDSLGFNVTDNKLSLYEVDQRAFEAFTNRAKTLFEINGKNKVKAKVLLNYLYNKYTLIMTEIIADFSRLNYNDVLDIINQVPQELMSAEQKKWVMKLIKYRHSWLINNNWGSVEN